MSFNMCPRQPRGRGVGDEAAPIWLWNEVEDGNFTQADILIPGSRGNQWHFTREPNCLRLLQIVFYS